MFSATTYAVRLATQDDDDALTRLAAVNSLEPLPPGPVLIGEIGGTPQVAYSLRDGRAIASPSHPTAALLARVRMRAGALGAYAHTPSLPARIRAALSGAVLARPVRAAA